MAEVTTEEEDGGDHRWSSLLPELLRLIYRKLPDTGDFLRFRAVCTAWRDAAPVSDPPSHLPWVLAHHHASSSYRLARPLVRFHSPSSSRLYSFRRAGRRSWILGSGTGQGHVVAIVDLSWTTLHNPVTGEARALPPAPFMPWSDGVFSVHFVDDGDEAGCVVVVNTCTDKRHFAFCFCRSDGGGGGGASEDEATGHQWRVFDKCGNLGSTAYHGGRFYANAACKATLAIDPATLAIEAVVPRPPGEDFSSARGDYLAVAAGSSSHGNKKKKPALLIRAVKHARSISDTTQPQTALAAPDFYFNLYQLVDVRAAAGAGGKQWTKVDSIGDAVLFFDDQGHGFSLEPNDAAGLTRDCVYFLHERKTWLRTVWADRFLCRYNIKEGKVVRTVPLGDAFADTWVIPNLCRSDDE